MKTAVFTRDEHTDKTYYHGMQDKIYIQGYGRFDYLCWDALKNADCRYVCTDYDYEPAFDLYEITDPKADEFGKCYATHAE